MVYSCFVQSTSTWFTFKYVATIFEQWVYVKLTGLYSCKEKKKKTVWLQNCSGYWPTLIWLWLWHCNHPVIITNYTWSFFIGTNNYLIVLCVSEIIPALKEKKTDSPSSIFSVLWDILWPGQGCLNTHTQSIAAGRHDKGDKILSGSHPGPLIKSSSTLCHTEMWLI